MLERMFSAALLGGAGVLQLREGRGAAGGSGVLPTPQRRPRAEGGEGGDVHVSPSALGFTLRKERSWNVALAQEGVPAVAGARTSQQGLPWAPLGWCLTPGDATPCMAVWHLLGSVL